MFSPEAVNKGINKQFSGELDIFFDNESHDAANTGDHSKKQQQH